MATDDPWTPKARGLLKAELKRREVSYPQLVEKLQAMGVQETKASITNKISRGAFTAAFLLQCMEAIGCHTLRLEDAGLGQDCCCCPTVLPRGSQRSRQREPAVSSTAGRAEPSRPRLRLTMPPPATAKALPATTLTHPPCWRSRRAGGPCPRRFVLSEQDQAEAAEKHDELRTISRPNRTWRGGLCDDGRDRCPSRPQRRGYLARLADLGRDQKAVEESHRRYQGGHRGCPSRRARQRNRGGLRQGSRLGCCRDQSAEQGSLFREISGRGSPFVCVDQPGRSPGTTMDAV